jgi:hypothetical protein
VEFPENLVPLSPPFSVAFFSRERPALSGEYLNRWTKISQGPEFQIGLQDRLFRFGNTILGAGVPFPDDRAWHHYTVTAAGDETRLYIDGNLAAKFAAIGKGAEGSTTRLGWYFEGSIDELWVFEGVLSQAEVADLARQGDAREFVYEDDGESITITGYTGRGGTVAIPDTMEGKPVTIIDSAFSNRAEVTSIILPKSVVTIRFGAFAGCAGLTNFSVDPLNPAFSSLEGGLYNKDQTDLLKFPEAKSGNFRVPNSVTGFPSFSGCTRLSSVILPDSVATHLGRGNNVASFDGCPSLRSIYFLGNAPSGFWYGSEMDPLTWVPFTWDLTGTDRATVFYRAGTTGWEGVQFGGRSAVLWVPTDDLDHDEMDNEKEMVAGTDPLDATSWLAFEGAPRPGALAEEDQTTISVGQHALYFQSIPGMRYEILSSDFLGGAWSSVATVDADALQKRVLVDRPASAAFYRIQVVP